MRKLPGFDGFDRNGLDSGGESDALLAKQLGDQQQQRVYIGTYRRRSQE
jgi:hypothetical protein